MSDDTYDLVAAASAELSGTTDDTPSNDSGEPDQPDTELDTASPSPEDTPAEPSAETLPASPEDAPVEPSSEPATEPDAEPVQKAEPETDEKSLRELEAELIAKNPSLKKGRLSTARHQAILTRTRRQLEAQIAELTPHQEVAQRFQSEDIQVRLKIADLMEKNPEALVKQVLVHDPRYRAIFESFAAPAAPAPPQAPPAAAPVSKDQPKPDVLLPDGSVGYSAQRSAELLDWRMAQERQAAEAREAKLAERLAAFEQQLAPMAQERHHTAQFNAALQRQRGVLEDARANWPGFKDHEAAMRAEMHKPGNERMTLEQAYRTVVVPTLKTDQEQLRAKLRSELLAEINKARPTSSRPSTPDVTANPNAEAMTTEQLVRAQVRALNANS